MTTDIKPKPKAYPIDWRGYYIGKTSSKDRALAVLRKYYGSAVKAAKLSRAKKPVWHPVFD